MLRRQYNLTQEELSQKSGIGKLPQMKLLILNASPRPKGNISQMLAAMQTQAESLGCETEIIKTNGLTIKPCTGCMKCRSAGRCSLPDDDAQRVLNLIRQCDVLIIGAPCYWGSMPGTLKVLFDRMVYGFINTTKGLPKPLLKGKRCILVSTSTTPWPLNIIMHQSHGVVRSLKEICRLGGLKIVSVIEKGDTRHNTSLTHKEARKCRQAILKLS